MVLDKLESQLDIEDVRLFEGTGLSDVKAIFDQHPIDMVIMGAGLDLQDRLDIIRYIFEKSKVTSVHMKDWDSGPAGMLPFVRKLLQN
jgi:hypothetical protein